MCYVITNLPASLYLGLLFWKKISKMPAYYLDPQNQLYKLFLHLSCPMWSWELESLLIIVYWIHPLHTVLRTTKVSLNDRLSSTIEILWSNNQSTQPEPNFGVFIPKEHEIFELFRWENTIFTKSAQKLVWKNTILIKKLSWELQNMKFFHFFQIVSFLSNDTVDYYRKNIKS